MIGILVPKISSDRIILVPSLVVKELNVHSSWMFVAVGEGSRLVNVAGIHNHCNPQRWNLGALASLAQVNTNLCTIYNHNRKPVHYGSPIS